MQGASPPLANDLRAALLDHVTDAVVVLDDQGALRYANPSAELLLGYEAKAWVGRNVIDLVHPDDRAATVTALLEDLGRPGRGLPYQVRLRTAIGDHVWVEAVGNNQREHPDIRGIVVCLRDIGARVAFEEQLRRDSFQDALTGLPNRRMLQHALASGRTGPGPVLPAAVLFCDLDNLKDVNDAIGHAAGDRLLQETAARIRSVAPTSDLVVRFGGDEFVLLVSGRTEDRDACALATAVRAAVEQPLDLGGTTVRPRISIGIAVPQPGDHDPHQLLARADAAMYASKLLSRAS